MAVLRRSIENETTINSIGSLAIICAISCTIIMLRFKGKLIGKRRKEVADDIGSLSINGAYRVNRTEFSDYGTLSDVPIKIITPAMVNLPQSSAPQLRPTQSTGNLVQVMENNDARMVRASTPEVVLDPRGKVEYSENIKTKKQIEKQEREQKKLQKQKAMLQKRKDKIIAKEQAKQEKLRKDLAKKDAQKQAKESKMNKTKAPPVPSVVNEPSVSNQPVAQPRSTNPLAKGAPYSTNTLESSISTSSGPPPYAEVQKTEVVKNKQDKTGNTSFGKKVESDDSWDLVSRHRQQMARPTTNIGNNRPKQTVLDLQFGQAGPTSSALDNSDA